MESLLHLNEQEKELWDISNPIYSKKKKGCKTKSSGETKRMPWEYFYWLVSDIYWFLLYFSTRTCYTVKQVSRYLYHATFCIMILVSLHTKSSSMFHAEFVYKLFPPKWRILTMKTLSSLFVFC
jgi:hypothetical protein